MRNTVPAIPVGAGPSNLIGHALKGAKQSMTDLCKQDAGRDEAKLRALTNEIVLYQRALDLLHGYVVTEEPTEPGR